MPRPQFIRHPVSPYRVGNIPLQTTDDDLPPRKAPRPPPRIPSPTKRLSMTDAGPHGDDTLYSSHYAHVVFKLRLLGFTTDRIAFVLGVTPQTLYKWQQTNMSFKEAWNNGGDFADAEVAHSLYQRAIGYHHEDTKVFYSSSANNGEGEIIYAPVTKYYPPDTTAATYWLNNRNRGKWRNMQNLELTGADGRDLQPPQLQINFVAAPARIETTSNIDVEGATTVDAVEVPVQTE